MRTFDGWRAVGRAMRWARQQDGASFQVTGLGSMRRWIYRAPNGRVEISTLPGETWLRAASPDGSVRDLRGNAHMVLRVLAALGLVPAELAEVHDERDERCTWCHRFGHAAEQHPLPKGHPQYDAFYDASDDELAEMVSNARKPGDAR